MQGSVLLDALFDDYVYFSSILNRNRAPLINHMQQEISLPTNKEIIARVNMHVKMVPGYASQEMITYKPHGA